MIAAVVGYAALSISLVGHALAARGKRAGWMIRCGAGVLWLAAGILNGAGPYIACSVIYLALDAYAVVRTRAKR